MRLHQAEAGQELGGEFFGPLGRRVEDTMAGYDARELALTEQFMRAMAEAMAEHRRSLSPAPTRPEPVGG